MGTYKMEILEREGASTKFILNCHYFPRRHVTGVLELI